MIPQNLTTPSILSNEFTSGNEKILPKLKKQEKDYEYCDNKRRVSLKNSKNGNEESIVQWKQKNIKDGFVIVDEAQLTKLIKREPIEKYYKLEQEPFATGLFASVRRCQSLETGENYAAKFSSRDRYGEDCSAEIYHEIALLSLCGSAPRVIQIHDVFENAKEIIIVMEYAPGGDLQTIIDENLVPFESDVMSFIKQTAEGLEYLHRRRIAHLDIKPQNIVMMGDYPNCEIKLCDFEISRVILEGDNIRELLGTPDYVAPEILHYDPITLAADMWSLGVTTYVLLTGFSPFGGETDQETFCNISRGDVDFPDELFKDVSNEAIDFIKSLLVKNPKARLTASACLKHPWFTSNEPKPQPVVNNEVYAKEEEIYKTRNGCETCQTQKQDLIETNPPSAKTLRKYLSKSREALFDKVVQKHNNNNNVKKHTNKNNRFRKTRLCESQISLLSKSRERLLGGETLNAPSRSIEKLYGLRSLSKSQEVLSLYQNGGILASQENLNIVSELIKSRENLAESMKEKKLMRARTADLGILHQRHKTSRMYSCSSTISLASLTNNMHEDDEENEEDSVLEMSIISNETTPGTPQIEPEFIRPHESLEKPSVIKNLENIEKTQVVKQPEIVEKSPIIKRIENLEERSRIKLKDEGDEDEPRFTVAQLITAYNKHQEIVTKTSLEVTMSAHQKEVKIPPIIPYDSKATFPTGPTALRLFIPDIDLVEMPKKSVLKYKTRFPEATEDPEDRLKKSGKLPDQQYSSQSSLATNSDKDLRSPVTEEPPSFVQKEHKKKPEEEKPPTLVVNQRRSKSSSPSIDTHRPEPVRKHSASGPPEHPKIEVKKSPTCVRKTTGRSVDRSPSATRKALTVEKSPVPQRRSSSRTSKVDDLYHKKSESSQYKIVGIGDKSTNSRKSSVSYKIEFDSPVVTRKFPIRNSPTKGTISSNLKVKEHASRTKK